MAVHLPISDTCVQNIWLSLEHLQPNLPRGGLDPVLGEHAYILFAYAIDRFRGDYIMPECPLRTKILCKVHLNFGRREFNYVNMTLDRFEYQEKQQETYFSKEAEHMLNEVEELTLNFTGWSEMSWKFF